MKKYKTFEGGTVKEVLARMLDEGFMPCSLKETWKQRETKMKLPLTEVSIKIKNYKYEQELTITKKYVERILEKKESLNELLTQQIVGNEIIDTIRHIFNPKKGELK